MRSPVLFLQTWRAALIPLAAVPVAIIGTFAAMAMAGFTINNLTLFGLVLAVGIVVDDAIVVVEAVQHQLEKGFTPREATLSAVRGFLRPRLRLLDLVREFGNLRLEFRLDLFARLVLGQDHPHLFERDELVLGRLRLLVPGFGVWTGRAGR